MEMASGDLTRGAVAAISEGGAEGMRPVLQVWDLRLVNTAQSTTERYRMLLSDGVHMQQAMLATQMNSVVKSGALQKGSIVQLNEFICNVIQGRRIIIVINLEVLRGESAMIGNPKTYDNGTSGSQARVPAAPQTSSIEQPGKSAGNSQVYGGQGGASVNPKLEPISNNPSVGSYGSGPMISGVTTNVNSVHPLPEQAARNFTVSHPPGGNQNERFSNAGPVGGFNPPGSTYMRPAQTTYQQPPPLYVNRGPIAKNEAPARIVPIRALNPYQGRWTIKARVTSKSELRRYNNPRGEGKVFSFDLLDSDGGEIRLTCFNTVADQFYDQVEVGKVYLISKGSLKPAQKSFNHLNNEFEIFLESTSTIQPCPEDNSIPKQQFSFRPISEIEGIENNSMVDVIGIVTSISPASTIMRKNGIETQKRTLQLKDMTGRSVEITLWGNFCNTEGQQLQSMCDSGVFPVLAVKAGRVSDFSGKSVGTISSSQLFIEPDFPEAHRLKEWYNREGKNVASLSISRDTSSIGRTDVRKTVSQIKDEGLGRAEKPDWITVKALVTFVKVDNFCYTACPLMLGDRQCNKKVNNNGDGTWHCDRCDQSFPECDYRYLLQFQIQDHTGTTWVTAFQESGEEIMGITAKELYLLKYEEQDDVKFAGILQGVLFNKYLFKLKVKEETFSDEQRVKSTVVKAEIVKSLTDSRYLLEKLSLEDPNAGSEMRGNFGSGAGISSTGFGSIENKTSVHSAASSVGVNVGVDRYRTEPANQLGQHVNEYGSIMNHNIGSRGPQLFCNSCNSAGHSIHNCPMGMNRQAQSFGEGFANRPLNASTGNSIDSNICFKCQQPGHWARDCPGLGATYGSDGAPGRYTKQYVGGY
ncbi:replication protein A 70 kDa DNA-binding subunit A-like [Typha latifolia]|uniref:replication protein A 70 kDa DNA-binding subunit A-like n=1 Tax=Typha latifolia TaxID=4733 RepID=UPI003C3094D5